MRSKAKLFVTAIVAVIIGTACNKKEILPEQVINRVALETVVKAGETYSLDLSAYSTRETRSTIVGQAAHAAESVLTNGTCQSAGNYRYKAGATATTDHVILRLSNGGTCKRQGGTTEITITIKVEPTPAAEV